MCVRLQGAWHVNLFQHSILDGCESISRLYMCPVTVTVRTRAWVGNMVWSDGCETSLCLCVRVCVCVCPCSSVNPAPNPSLTLFLNLNYCSILAAAQNGTSRYCQPEFVVCLCACFCLFVSVTLTLNTPAFSPQSKVELEDALEQCRFSNIPQADID